LQFGVLDLLMLTTVVAVVVVLYRPMPSTSRQTPPPRWLVGGWMGWRFELWLYPDGYYTCYAGREYSEGLGWRASSAGSQSEVLLECGKQRLTVRSEPSTGTMDVLGEDGRAWARATQLCRWEGRTLNGRPDGTWKLAGKGQNSLTALEYRGGELVGFRGPYGQNDLLTLNKMRRERGLSELAGPASPSEGTAQEVSQ
jgi:hypothetical protein